MAQKKKKLLFLLSIPVSAFFINGAYAQPARYKNTQTTSTLKYAGSFEPSASFIQLQGVLKRTFRISLPFTKKKPTFFIEDASGKKLAYVDTTRLISDRPITDYLNQRVMISGPIEKNNVDGRTIIASNIQVIRKN
jgi:hypothetical protein